MNRVTRLNSDNEIVNVHTYLFSSDISFFNGNCREYQADIDNSASSPCILTMSGRDIVNKIYKINGIENFRVLKHNNLYKLEVLKDSNYPWSYIDNGVFFAIEDTTIDFYNFLKATRVINPKVYLYTIPELHTYELHFDKPILKNNILRIENIKLNDDDKFIFDNTIYITNCIKKYVSRFIKTMIIDIGDTCIIDVYKNKIVFKFNADLVARLNERFDSMMVHRFRTDLVYYCHLPMIRTSAR